jgi:hypothetical protein
MRWTRSSASTASMSVSRRARSLRSASSAGQRPDRPIGVVTRDELLLAADAPDLLGGQVGQQIGVLVDQLLRERASATAAAARSLCASK